MKIDEFGMPATGGGADVSGVTAEAADVDASKKFVAADGTLTDGTLATVTPPAPTVSVDPGTALVTASYTPVAGRVKDTTAKSGTLQLTAKAAATITPGTADQTIPAGQYLTGAQTIKGDANLLAGNVKSGVSLFGITGTLAGETGFYQCASVNITSHTWTGYKATFTDGKWSYADTVTSGLSYSSGSFTPVVGSTYNDGCTVKATLALGIPMDGLVFYAPFATQESAAATGQSLSYAGSYSFASVEGISAIHTDGACVTTGVVADSDFDSGFAMSLWFRNDSWSYNAVIAQMGPWGGSADSWWGVQSDNGYSWIYYQALVGSGSNHSLSANKWYHLVYQISGGTAKAWIDGEADLNQSVSYQSVANSGNSFYIGNIGGSTSRSSFHGYIAAVRLYNRALTSDEIAALAHEFTPVYEQ